jgi:putative oxidoreductase
MKYIANICGVLLGLVFVAVSAIVLFKLMPMQALPEGTPAWHFFEAFAPTGYFTFVKVLEMTGGVLVAIPRIRGLGLLILGPIIVNILAYHFFVQHSEGLTDLLPVIIITVLALVLLFCERRAFLTLIWKPKSA